MIDLTALLADPLGQEVLWDYCLERNLPMPDRFLPSQNYGLDALSGGWRHGIGFSGHSIAAHRGSLSLSGELGRHTTEHYYNNVSESGMWGLDTSHRRDHSL